MKKFLLSIIFVIIGICNLYSQTGSIKGTIIDFSTSETLIGANIRVTGTTIGTITDLDGNYLLNNIPPGTTSITISYISYESQTFEIEVISNEIVELNANLSRANQNLEEVVVVARKREETEAAILVMKKKMPSIIDAVSSQQISRMGDSNAAAALKRVTGVSVQNGKYIYIRGLSDRYSTTTLNGAQIPSLDPERNSVQMDIFPSSIIENLTVFKTFSPDLPGNSSGGLINITTKDFPDKFNLYFKSKFGYSPGTNFNKNFLTYQGGKTDWLGIDDGTRSIPSNVLNYGQLPFIYTGLDEEIGDLSRSFNKYYDNTFKTPFLNQSYSLSLGNTVNLFNKPLGFNFGISYKKDFQYYEGKSGKYAGSTDFPSTKRTMKEYFGQEEVIWSSIGNISYKLNSNNKIGLTVLRNQSGIKTSRFSIGFANDPDATSLFEKKLGWLERSITSYQLKGKHVFPSLNNSYIDWNSSIILSKQLEPDLRFFFSDFDTNTEGDTIYSIRLNNSPARFYREMNETGYDIRIDYTQPISIGKIKFGGSYVNKERLSLEHKYSIERQGSFDFDGTAYDYLRDENFWWPERWNKVYYTSSNLSDVKNSYRGYEKVYAGYLLGDFKIIDNFRVIGGIRYELANIFVENLLDSINFPTKMDHYSFGGFKDSDILPSLNFVYTVIPNMNLRLGYGKTVARPVFRELAPYAAYDYKAGLRKIGNPNLERTIIDNIDFRWEWYFKPQELLSVSLFYKYFQNPIELRDAQQAANPEIHFENIEDAQLYGLEFEVRKKVLKNFLIGTNITLVKSFVTEDSLRLVTAREIDPTWPEKRPMFGQSPYVINTYVNYHNQSGWDANLGFNVAGKRIMFVNKAATPDVYEQPFPVLDFNIGKTFKNGIILTFAAENLLNPEFSQTYDFGEDTGYFQQYKIGRSFSLSIAFVL